MALRMAQPWQHPKTGVYWFRRAVPRDLRALVGKREELITLRTKDLALARVRYAKVSAEVEARWANLRAGPKGLTEHEAYLLAAPLHDEWLTRHRANPNDASGWRTELYDQLWPSPTSADLTQPLNVRVRELALAAVSPARAQEAWCLAQADNVLSKAGLLVDEPSRAKLAKAVAHAIQRASLALGRAARGDYAELPEPDITEASTRFSDPTWQPASKRSAGDPGLSAGKVTMSGLLEAFWKDAKAAGRKPSTYESYSHTIRNFIEFIKHDDAR